jgi:hypothetical protein
MARESQAKTARKETAGTQTIPKTYLQVSD